jgi:hypothetical protein
MKFKIKKEVEVDVKTLKVRAGVRYYEDATINGVEDTEGDLTPCKEGENWCPIIEIETGIIKNWEQGKTADVHFKVCDDGNYYLLDKNEEVVLEKDGYVPDCLAINSNGYGDYIIMKIDENGIIEDWKFDIDDFIEEED